MTEDQLQSKCWQWAWNTHPDTRRLLWAVPNGGDRDIMTAIKLQATGVVAGVHDLHFFWRGQLYTFELKVNGNELTQDRTIVTKAGQSKVIFGQQEWGAKIASQGGRWFKITEFEQFKQLFNRILNNQL